MTLQDLGYDSSRHDAPAGFRELVKESVPAGDGVQADRVDVLSVLVGRKDVPDRQEAEEAEEPAELEELQEASKEGVLLDEVRELIAVLRTEPSTREERLRGPKFSSVILALLARDDQSIPEIRSRLFEAHRPRLENVLDELSLRGLATTALSKYGRRYSISSTSQLD